MVTTKRKNIKFELELSDDELESIKMVYHLFYEIQGLICDNSDNTDDVYLQCDGDDWHLADSDEINAMLETMERMSWVDKDDTIILHIED